MPIRMGLIGKTGHWREYAPLLDQLPDFEIAAVAAVTPEEQLEDFDGAPGVTAQTKRYDDPFVMLNREQLDVVQVCTRPDLMPACTIVSVERGLPVMAEKPLAMDLEMLHRIWERAHAKQVLVLPMHTHRGDPVIATVQDAIQRGEIGEPLCSYHQKSYKWGKRDDYHRSRRTFPGLAPFIGIHALDWIYWITGDLFTEVYGSEAPSAHPDFPATASQAGFLFKQKNGGIATMTLDYLRPETAPTHGDERVRIAGTRGVIEARRNIENRVILINEEGQHDLDLITPPHWYARFIRAALGKQDTPPMTMRDAFRITEISIKAQQSADEDRPISLLDSPYTVEAR